MDKQSYDACTCGGTGLTRVAACPQHGIQANDDLRPLLRYLRDLSTIGEELYLANRLKYLELKWKLAQEPNDDIRRLRTNTLEQAMENAGHAR